ncbi:MAG: class C sortase [Leucobacter sp.]
MTLTELQAPRRRTPSAASGPAAREERGSLSWGAVVIAIVFFTGTCVITYPTAAAWFTQLQQSQRIVELSGEVGELSPSARELALDAAHTYNSALIGGASIAAGERLPLADADTGIDGASYSELLRADRTGLMARLKIPAIEADLPIYHGTSDEVLREGVGHLEGTALPVGGASTHSVLTGHRGLADAEIFTRLDQVHVGDTFTIEVFGEVLTYRVRNTAVVSPDQTESLHPEQGQDLVTLVTCTPLGINSHRILVTGERITPTPPADLANAGQAPTVPGFPWWAIIVGATAIAGVAYVRLSSRRPSTSTTQQKENDHV